MNVSVIFPVYNAQNTIERAVFSVLSQLDNKDQIILVNDGSTDQSGNVCDHLAVRDERVRVIHQSNKGISAARNAGLRAATNEYIAFVDADDAWNDGVWDKIKQAFDQRGIASVGMFDYELYDTITHQKKSMVDYHPVNHQTMDGISFVKELGKYAPDFGISVMRFVVERKLIVEHQLWFEDGKYYEDALWTFQMLLAAPSVFYLPVVVFAYSRNVPNQVTSSFSAKKLFDRMWICSYWLEEIGNYLTDPADVDRFLKRISVLYFSTLIAVREQSPETQRELLPELIKLKAYLNYPHSTWNRLASWLCRGIGIENGSRVFHQLWRLRRLLG